MKFCCSTFKHLLQNQEERGWSVIVNECNASPAFFVVFRSLNNKDLPLWNDVVKQSGISEKLQSLEILSLEMLLGSEVPITFCPWCGRRLIRSYKKTWRAIASEHKWE